MAYRSAVLGSYSENLQMLKVDMKLITYTTSTPIKSRTENKFFYMIFSNLVKVFKT